MCCPAVEVISSGPDITSWLSAGGSILAACAAAYAIWVARSDLRKSKKQQQAQMTYQIHKDVLDFVNSKNGKSTPAEKLLFYYSMYNLMENGLLHGGLETMVRQDIETASKDSDFTAFWSNKENRKSYPMDFQTFISQG